MFRFQKYSNITFELLELITLLEIIQVLGKFSERNYSFIQLYKMLRKLVTFVS